MQSYLNSLGVRLPPLTNFNSYSQPEEDRNVIDLMGNHNSVVGRNPVLNLFVGHFEHSIKIIVVCVKGYSKIPLGPSLKNVRSHRSFRHEGVSFVE